MLPPFYTAILRKVVGKSARDNPERYCGWLWGPLFQRNLKEWRGRPWTYVCEYYRKATKVGSTASVVTNSVLIISHITFWDCHVRISSDNLSRNSCILAHLSVSLRGMVYTCQEESLHIYYIVTPVHLVLQVPVQFIQNTIKTDEESIIFLCQM